VDEAIAQALQIAADRNVTIGNGSTVELPADTICVHGDRADAGMFAKRLREALERSGALVRRFAP
jgi:UPF0271 protein